MIKHPLPSLDSPNQGGMYVSTSWFDLLTGLESSLQLPLLLWDNKLFCGSSSKVEIPLRWREDKQTPQHRRAQAHSPQSTFPVLRGLTDRYLDNFGEVISRKSVTDKLCLFITEVTGVSRGRGLILTPSTGETDN